MQLIGMLDSPYVRRTAISLKLLGLPFEHRSVSVFRNFEEFRRINPLVRAPTLVCDDGEVLCESTLILDYLERLAGKSLMPEDARQHRQGLRLLGIALTACDKTAQIVYEREQRPPEKLHQPWVDRVHLQLGDACRLLETAAMTARPWLLGERLSQADVTTAVAWTFIQYYVSDLIKPAQCPVLAAWTARAERLPEFLSTPLP